MGSFLKGMRSTLEQGTDKILFSSDADCLFTAGRRITVIWTGKCIRRCLYGIVAVCFPVQNGADWCAAYSQKCVKG